MRVFAYVCVGGVALGPLTWLASLAGVVLPWFSVRRAFVVMLFCLLAPDVIALTHVACFARLSRRRRWAVIHKLFSKVEPFSAFEYLIDPVIFIRSTTDTDR